MKSQVLPVFIAVLCWWKQIYIFGKSNHNFAESIKSPLNIDCYAYDTNNNLFICQTSYYKRLFKVSVSYRESGGNQKRNSNSFQAQSSAKRLPCPSDGNDDEISDVQRSLSTNQANAERTLSFSNSIVTPRASSFGIQQQVVGVNPLSHVLSPILLWDQPHRGFR